MYDPYLDAIMHGEIFSEKKPLPLNRYELEYQKTIKNNLLVDESNENLLIPQHLRLKKNETKVRELLELEELNQHLEKALQILSEEAERYLGLNAYKAVQENLLQALKILDTIPLENFQLESLGAALKILPETTEAIFKIALAKFDEKSFSAALSLMVLLVVFHPEDFDFWYRSGIISQLLGNDDYALKAYATAISLNKNLIGARIYASECYLKLKQNQEAIAEFEEAQRIAAEQDLPKEWSNLVSTLKQKIEKLH